jgi:hypothetical protein
MKSVDGDDGSASVSAPTPISARIPRRVSQFEEEIRQLYLRTIDEPIPPRLMSVLRGGLPNYRS